MVSPPNNLPKTHGLRSEANFGNIQARYHGESKYDSKKILWLRCVLGLRGGRGQSHKSKTDKKIPKGAQGGLVTNSGMIPKNSLQYQNNH